MSSLAVGMVESRGLPPTLAAADAMCKAARVTLVAMEKLSGGFYTVIVRGDVAEVKRAVEAGMTAAKTLHPYLEGDKLFISSHVIPRPHANVDRVLNIHFRDSVALFRV
ncbi:MAG: BMC domain-containing protein [Gloeomargaritaceae cyanobacterium C42_A2020_066]|nr:BMC domain-containing protein [Gloeomargaritaceae cyanobacterium C42_A2020_066]